MYNIYKKRKNIIVSCFSRNDFIQICYANKYTTEDKPFTLKNCAIQQNNAALKQNIGAIQQNNAALKQNIGALQQNNADIQQNFIVINAALQQLLANNN